MLGTTATNAEHARKIGFLRETDVTSFHPDRLLFEAKRLALEAQPSRLPTWLMPQGPLAGMIDRLQQEAQSRGLLTDHDTVIGDKVKSVFAKSTSFDDALARERAGFVDLLKNGLTVARIRHMLETGKPMKN
jgi:3-hydroxyacyl-CoA dehydrogenase